MADCFRHRLALVAVMATLLMLAAPSWGAQVLVYAQNPDYLNLYASQNDTSGLGINFTSYDNFALGTSTAITSVEWVGGYYNPQTAGAITGWTVGFYANNAGQPGSLLSSFAISGNGGESSLGFDSLGDPVYLYGASVSFAAGAGTSYWLSVVPDLPYPPQWGWTTSSQGDGISYTLDPFGNLIQNSTDLSFALYETQNSGVPEPGSLALFGTAIVGVASGLRRKFRA